MRIVRFREALETVGIEAELFRWYDANQKGDIFHFFGRVPIGLLHLSRQKNMRVVFNDSLAGFYPSRGLKRQVQKLLRRFAQRILPDQVTGNFAWESYRQTDACILATEWEAQLAAEVFGADRQKLHVVRDGVEAGLLGFATPKRDDWLLIKADFSTGGWTTKMVNAAIQANIPLKILIRKEDEPRAEKLTEMVFNQQIIRIEKVDPGLESWASALRSGRGLVLAGQSECVPQLALDAAACECPMLANDTKAMRVVFGESMRYYQLGDSIPKLARLLRQFYDEASQMSGAAKPLTWEQTASRIRGIYEALPNTSR